MSLCLSSKKKRSRLLFGRFEKITWALARLALRLAPQLTVQTILGELTTLEVKSVMQRMSAKDFRFVCRMLKASQSGSGFMNDIEHQIKDLSHITVPVLAMYSPYDKTVPPAHAKRVAAEVKTCELYEVLSDTHLIWIGPSAKAVWQKRLSFLQAIAAPS